MKAALDIELFLLPAVQLIKKTMGEAFPRIVSSPLYEEVVRLAEERWGSNKRASPTTSSPLLPHLFFPWWRPPPVEIVDSKELAIARHNQIRDGIEGISIYTDRSAVKGHIGAAATAPSVNISRKMYIHGVGHGCHSVRSGAPRDQNGTRNCGCRNVAGEHKVPNIYG